VFANIVIIYIYVGCECVRVMDYQIEPLSVHRAEWRAGQQIVGLLASIARQPVAGVRSIGLSSGHSMVARCSYQV
jgi:hypothetical protein